MAKVYLKGCYRPVPKNAVLMTGENGVFNTVNLLQALQLQGYPHF